MNETQKTYLSNSIPGWGSDLPLENRPGVPRESRSREPSGAHWIDPDQQFTPVKIYHTVERPSVTPVFGTTCPPHGLSGKLRDYAYTLGEGRLSRWMTLILADRVDVWENRVSELISGREPQTDAARLARRAVFAVGAVSIAALAAAAIAKKRREREVARIDEASSNEDVAIIEARAITVDLQAT